MKNKMSDLNDHLFAQLERLADEGMSAEQIAQEVSRAGAIVDVADRIAGVADLGLKAARLYADHGAKILPMLPALGATAQPARHVTAPEAEE